MGYASGMWQSILQGGSYSFLQPFSSTALVITLVPPVVKVPEDNGTAKVCYMTDTELSEAVVINVTSSVKPPGSPDAACECVNTKVLTLSEFQRLSI